VSLAHEGSPRPVRRRHPERSQGEGHATDLGYTIRDPDKAKRYERNSRAELADGKRRLLRRWGLHRRCRADGLDDRRDGALRIGPARDGSRDPGAGAGDDVRPRPPHHGEGVQSLRRGIFNQHVLLEAGAFAGLLGGLLGLFVFPSFPTVHFFAVSVFITTYHILSEYTSLIVRTRALPPSRVFSISPAGTRPVASPTTEMLRTFLPTTSRSRSQVRVKPVKMPSDGVVGVKTVDESTPPASPSPRRKDRGRRGYRGAATGTLLVEVTAIGDDAFLNQSPAKSRARR